MIDAFPRVKQPSPMGCLPTCVRAVLKYGGENVSYADAAAWCREFPEGGCDWFEALDGLREQGYAVEEVAGEDDTTEEALLKLHGLVEEQERPVIARLLTDLQAGANHAVVILGFSGPALEGYGVGRTIHYMDPASGFYDDKPTPRFLQE
jgi:hypothetical protein